LTYLIIDFKSLSLQDLRPERCFFWKAILAETRGTCAEEPEWWLFSFIISVCRCSSHYQL